MNNNVETAIELNLLSSWQCTKKDNFDLTLNVSGLKAFSFRRLRPLHPD